MKTVDLKQNTPEWLEWRNGKPEDKEFRLGASDAGVIMGVNPYESVTGLFLRKLGELPPVEENDAMRRGSRLEPFARHAYAVSHGEFMPPLCVVHDDHEWMSASLDGISDCGTVLLEIKCPGRRTREDAKKGKIPAYYYSQLQHQAAVTGATRLLYYSWTDDADEEPVLMEIPRSDEYIERLIRREKLFVECLKVGKLDNVVPFQVPDAHDIRGSFERTDKAFTEAVSGFLAAYRAKTKLADWIERLEVLMGRKKQVIAFSGRLKLERVLTEDLTWQLSVTRRE